MNLMNPLAVQAEQADETQSRYRFLIYVSLAVGFAILASGLAQQLVHPFLRHDDMDYLIKPGEPFAGDLLRKVLNEGRWLNYLWYKLISQHMRMDQAYAVYLVGMVATSVGIVWHVRSAAIAALMVFALILSAPLVDVSLWAATLGPGLIIAALGIFALQAGANPVAVMLVCLPLLLHTYPPFSQLLLFAYLLKNIDRPFWELFRVVLAYVVGYAIGIASIYAINYAYFGYPGVLIEEWRQPNPAHSLSDALMNLGELWAALKDLFSRFTLMVVAGLIGVAISLALAETRRRALMLLGYVALMIAMEAAITAQTGVTSFWKSYLWLWPACLAPWLFIATVPERRAQIAGGCLLVLLCVYSWGLASAALTDVRRAVEHDEFLARYAQTISGTSRPHIVLYGDPRHAPDLTPLHVSRQVNKYLWLRYGMLVTECTPDECAAIDDKIRNGETAPFMLDGKVVFVFSQRGQFDPYGPLIKP